MRRRQLNVTALGAACGLPACDFYAAGRGIPEASTLYRKEPAVINASHEPIRARKERP